MMPSTGSAHSALRPIIEAWEENMEPSNQELYAKIMSLEIDEENIDFTFSDRLSRENKWKKSYSRRCVDEYKRFIYLSSISNNCLTPSDQVDQVWHLHLTYTKFYWINLCRNILNTELHHGPTKGGEIEIKKYKEQYQDTLNIYKKEFNELPPNDIWPGLEKRFKNADKFIRLNSTEYTIFKEKYKTILFFLFLPIAVYASENNAEENDFWFYVKVILGIYVVFKIVKWINKNSGSGSGGAGCGGCSGCGG